MTDGRQAMRRARTAAIGGAGLLLLGARAPAERVVAAEGMVAATVNGTPGRLRISPAGTAMPLLTADWAARAGLRAGMFGVGYAVGPTVVDGSSAVARVGIGGAEVKRRVAWAAGSYRPAFDGMVGPGGVPEPVVRFALRPPRSGERTAALRMADGGGLFGGWGERFALVEVGGRPMRVRFDPHARRTLATAGAGRRIAEAFGGALDGPISEEEIAFGIRRPVRAMTLVRPFAIGALRIDRLGVRTADFGNASGIGEAGAAPDPDEVVVTAKGKRNVARDRLTLGADVLARYSSIVFDKPTRLVRLTCG